MFERFLHYKILFFIIILSFSFDLKSNEIIKLRFNEINIKFEPEKKSHNQNSKKLIKSISRYFLKVGKSENFIMNIILKRYNVKVIKPQKDDLLRFFKGDDFKVYVHEVNLVIDVINSSKLIDSIILNVSTSREFEDNLSLTERRLINSKIYKELDKKLKNEIKKKLLLKFGDFFVPN